MAEGSGGGEGSCTEGGCVKFAGGPLLFSQGGCKRRPSGLYFCLGSVSSLSLEEFPKVDDYPSASEHVPLTKCYSTVDRTLPPPVRRLGFRSHRSPAPAPALTIADDCVQRRGGAVRVHEFASVERRVTSGKSARIGSSWAQVRDPQTHS